MLHDSFRQFVSIGLSEFSYNRAALDWFRGRLPNHYFYEMTSTFAARSDDYVVFGREVLNVATVAALIFTALILGGVSSPQSGATANEIGRRKIWRLATYILLAGIALNAIVCGSFSSIHDRYQARVIWLVALSLVTGVFVMQPQRRIASCWKRMNRREI